MLTQRILWTLLITVVIAASTTHAQSAGRKSWPRGASVSARDASAPDKAAGQAPAWEAQTASKEPGAAAAKGGGLSEFPIPPKKAIVGSWLGTSGEGNRLLVSFNSDGVVTSSVQSEVSTNPELGVLTPGHGVWTYLGDRQFSFTIVGVLYDINTGTFLGTLKARGLLTLDSSGDQISGTDKVEIFGPDGGLVFSVPEGPLQLTRIKAEPFN